MRPESPAFNTVRGGFLFPRIAVLLAAELFFCGCTGERFVCLKRPPGAESRNYAASFKETWAASESAAAAMGLSVWEEDKSKGCFSASRGPGAFQGSKELRVCLKSQAPDKTAVSVADDVLSWGGIFKPDAPGFMGRFFAAIRGALPAARGASATKRL